MIDWAKKISQLFYESKQFVTPYQVVYNKNAYMPYSRIKKQLNKWLEEAEATIKYDGYFFVNLQDYIYSEKFFTKPIYGISYGSRFIDCESGNSLLSKKELEKARDLEREKLNRAFCIYSPSNVLKNIFISNGVASQIKVCGSPVFPSFLGISNNNKREFKILFNHRLVAQKNPSPLFDFPEEWRKRIVISTPLAFSQAYCRQLKENKNIMEINRDNGKMHTKVRYARFLQDCKYGLCFSYYESFGFSVAEGLLAGICYLCPSHKNVPFEEFVHPKALYDGKLLNNKKELILKIVEMIEHFEKDDKLREEIVAYSQKKLKKYQPRIWLSNMLKELKSE
jgi:hypothetical protein